MDSGISHVQGNLKVANKGGIRLWEMHFGQEKGTGIQRQVLAHKTVTHVIFTALVYYQALLQNSGSRYSA